MAVKVLVIDDSEHLRSVISMTLEFKGHEVITAEDGEAGLREARKGGFAFIFCDIEMPIMNGLEFVSAYREEFGPDTPIVILTAEEGDIRERALAAGANDLMIKPFEPIKMLEQIEKYV